MSRRLPLPLPGEVIAAPGPTPSGLTETRVPFAGPNGRLVDDSTLVFSGGTFFAPQLVVQSIVNLVGKITQYNNELTKGFGIPAILDDVGLTAQNASIGSTGFLSAATAGTYRVGFYLHCTTADLTAGSISLSVTFNDGVGARTLTSMGVALTSTANKTTKFTNTDIDGSLIKLGSGSIAWSTTLVGIAGTAQYALYITLERLS